MPTLYWTKGIDRPQLNYAGRPFYQLGIAGFKASLCLNYLRLISGTSKTYYRILIYVVIAISTLGHLAGTLVLIFDCQPVRPPCAPPPNKNLTWQRLTAPGT